MAGPASAPAEPLPADGGIVNVHDYGAHGNGRDDDTAALLKAIAASGGDLGRSFWHDKIIYLPDGTYPVSGTLLKRYANGAFASGMFLMGQSRAGAVIRLVDHAPGFDDPSHPRAVVFTSSKLLDGTPTGGGKDYTRFGEGNDAYMNFVQDLTIDVGNGNPGAIAIDYLANNVGAIRNVTLRAGPDSGAVGLSMTRKWPGPALIDGLSVRGFAMGIDVAQTEYGLTFDHIGLDDQRVAAIRDHRNVLAIRDLSVRGDAPAIVNAAPEGLIAIDGARLTAAGGAPAAPPITNRGTLVVRRLQLAGYPAIPGVQAGEAVLSSGNGWTHAALPEWVARAAQVAAPIATAPERWVSAAKFGAMPDPHRDASAALSRAFASGAAVVYLPHGEYWIAAGIDIPPSLRRIVGMNSSLHVLADRNPRFSRESGILRIATGGENLSIENLALDNTDHGTQLGIEVSGPRDVYLRDIVTAGVGLLDRKAGGGRVFIADVCCGHIRLAGPQPVSARQLDIEAGGVRIVNRGAPLSVLGLKTEGAATVLDNLAGAQTDVFGGLIYMVHRPAPASPPIPAFRNDGGWLLATFAEEALRPDSRYAVYLVEGEGAGTRDVTVGAFPARGYGRIVPRLVAGPAGAAQ